MLIQKALCLFCERPTADGAVLAVHVDKEKLQTYFINAYELAEEVKDDDLICYFCLWHAEFQGKFNVVADENLVGWNLDLDDAALELRKNYFEEKLQQCWVQLEKIELPESDSEVKSRPTEAKQESRPWNCFYCKMQFKFNNQLSKHMKKNHKEAIRCGNRKCATYFHSLEEKEEHTKNVHESSKETKKFECSSCGKEIEGPSNFSKHVHRVHTDFRVKCSHIGCLSFFKTQLDMKTHFDSAHKSENEAKRFQCNDCGYGARFKYILKEHIINKHIPKSSECHLCDSFFSSAFQLRKNVRETHTFKVCPLCKLSVTVGSLQCRHLQVKSCHRCKNKFQCSGLYQSHLKSCKKSRSVQVHSSN